MRKLLAYLKPYWKLVVLAPLLMIVEVIVDLLQPTLLAKIVDVGIAGQDLTLVMRTGLFMIGIALIGMLGGMGCTVAASIASQSFGTDLRSDLFKKIQSFSYADLETFKISTLITRLTNDIAQVQMLVLMSLRIMVRAPLLGVGGIIMAISINARLAMILLASVPALLLILFFVIQKSFPLFTMVQQKLDRVNAVMRENLSGIRLIKVFNRSTYEKKRFSITNSELMNNTIKAFKLVISIMPVMMLIMNLSLVAVIWFGGIQVSGGTMKVGEIMAFINYFMQILFSLMMVSAIFIFITRANASAERIHEVLSIVPQVQDPSQPDQAPLNKGMVEFEKITFQYGEDGNEPALKDISFAAQPGEIVAILGRTGSGKSTLMNLIPRLYDVNQGRVKVDGRDVRTFDFTTLRSSIGMVPQDTVLFSGTIKENIKWGNTRATDQDVIAAAKIAQADQFISQFPEGYDTSISQGGTNLSGGQKQRVAIARAIIKKPLILILDDSTSAVDLATEKKILSALKETLVDTTIFIVAQRISTVLDADCILLLDNGRIVGQGNHSQLMKNNSIYQEIYQSQLGEGVTIYD